MITVQQPSTEFEERLWAAFEAGATALCLGMLRDADFALPMTKAAAEGLEPVAWPTVVADGRTWMLAYTSAAAMVEGNGGWTEHHRIASMVDLAAGWPDPRWGLAINLGLPVSFLLESGTVARLAVPTLAQDLLLDPEAGVPLLQKLLSPSAIKDMVLGGEDRVSGYVHHALDVAHIATPAVLVDALGQPAMLTPTGSVNLLRWRPVGLELYRTPYGGLDEERRDAVAGWVVEEPPFIGLGLVPNVDQVIREYKVYGVGLTHGAEIWELADDGLEYRRAFYHGDLRRWLLVRPA
ncbi:SseB family protein [Nonomuraea recticatena]|uniref:SseB protein N-terminal domain-containing protein n=1 Tax=Nonomuraea recticatena TaxID=46178 RepID=A0ABN3S007_9ACTN